MSHNQKPRRILTPEESEVLWLLGEGYYAPTVYVRSHEEAHRFALAWTQRWLGREVRRTKGPPRASRVTHTVKGFQNVQGSGAGRLVITWNTRTEDRSYQPSQPVTFVAAYAMLPLLADASPDLAEPDLADAKPQE